MKIRFTRMISILCAAMLMVSAAAVWAYAEENAATPTDLSPVNGETVPEEPDEVPEESEPAQEQAQEQETEDGPVASVEVIITKTLGINQSWEGKTGKKKPAVLKLDLTSAGMVYMLVEGKYVWAAVEKTDSVTENPARAQTDPETGKMIISWEAEAGSYLITLEPAEPYLAAMAKVTFMDADAYETWEAEQEEAETPEGPVTDKPESEEPEAEIPEDEEPEEEQENKPESETETGRHITVDVTWDVPNPVIGDTAHMKAILTGYEGLTYTMQWQYSPDQQTWYDIPGETEAAMDVVVTKENNIVYWRILVYVEEAQEE